MKKHIIDFHSHILPGCDHGSPDVETSLKQLSLAAQAGVDIICATSHFYAHKEDVNSFLARRNKSYAILRAVAKDKIPVIIPGAEVLAFEGIDRLPDLERLCLAGTNILLLEMPFTAWSDSLLSSVEKLCLSKKIRVVLAHIDRYDEQEIRYLCSFGAYCQINAESCSGIFTKKTIKSLISDGSVVFMGSDIHGVDDGYSSWNKMKKRNSDLFEEIQMESNRFLFK